MCTLCAEFRPLDKDCAFDPGTSIYPDFASITEGGDAPSGTSTSYSMSSGDTFAGYLSLGDQDWVRIQLTAGDAYEITLDRTGLDGLDDPYLRLYDANGNQVAFNDDRILGQDLESTLVYTASTTGTYYIVVDAYASASDGDYIVEVQDTAPLPPLRNYTLNEISEQLTDGYWESTGRGPRSFNASPGDELTVNLSGLTNVRAEIARDALESWTNVTGITFRETTGSAQITFDDEESGAYASSSVSGSTITSSFVNVSRDWNGGSSDIDDYTFQTYIHEIGHALGLGHAGDYNGNATFGQDNSYLNDSWQATVMSYFSQSENPNIDASYAYIISPMMADIVAIQSLYGTPTNQRTGNTVYGFNSTAGGYLDEITSLSGPIALTILDSGGTDVINLAGYSNAQRIDLRPGTVSDIGGLDGNMFIWRNTVIENANGGSAGDTIQGNGVGNVVQGNGGNDTMFLAAGADLGIGGAGNDTIIGGDGNDTIDGGFGADTMDGGAGMDTVRFFGSTNISLNLGTWGSQGTGQGFDIVRNFENVLTGAGNDVVQGNASRNIITLGAGDDKAYGNNGNDKLVGGDGVDFLFGGNGNDELLGGNLGDQLFGGFGNDIMRGSGGNDFLEGGFGNDIYDGGAGIDTARYTVGANLRINIGTTNVQTTGAGEERFISIENVTAGSGNDIIYGGSVNNVLQGRNGADTLFGYAGNDTLLGGSGTDTIYGGNGRDFITGGAGADTISGGALSDVFIYRSGDGFDRITDFEDGVDRIRIVSGATNFGQITVTDVGTDARINFGNVQITLEDIDHTSITTVDFTFG